MKSIRILLPHDRFYFGQLFLEDPDGVAELGPFEADGKSDSEAARAHGNPARKPELPFGDTPIGDYTGAIAYECDTPEHRRSFGLPDGTGKIPVIALTAVEGDTLAWRCSYVRTGLMIHAGEPNGRGQLRPTHGCVRVFQDGMTKLLAGVAGLTGFPVHIEEKAVIS